MMKRRRQRLVLWEMRVEKEVEHFLLRYGSQQIDVSLFRAFPIPHAGQLGPGGEVDAFFCRLTGTVMDDTLPYEVQKKKEAAVTQSKPRTV